MRKNIKSDFQSFAETSHAAKGGCNDETSPRNTQGQTRTGAAESRSHRPSRNYSRTQEHARDEILIFIENAYS